MKTNPSFNIYLRSTTIAANKKLIITKNPTLRKRVIYNFLCLFSPILENWLASVEKFQIFVNVKWQVDFKLPEHFENFFVDHVDCLQKLVQGRRITNFPTSRVAKKVNKKISLRTVYRKNIAGEIALILLIENFYFYFYLWVESWAPNNIIDKTRSIQQYPVLLGNNEMRLNLLLILEQQIKKSRKYSLKEIEESKEIFQQLLRKLFSK